MCKLCFLGLLAIIIGRSNVEYSQGCCVTYGHMDLFFSSQGNVSPTKRKLILVKRKYWNPVRIKVVQSSNCTSYSVLPKDIMHNLKISQEGQVWGDPWHCQSLLLKAGDTNQSGIYGMLAMTSYLAGTNHERKHDVRILACKFVIKVVRKNVNFPLVIAGEILYGMMYFTWITLKV